MANGTPYAKGAIPNTSIAMSSGVRIFAKDGQSGQFQQIGTIQTFKPSDSRKMERVRGVGYGDRVVEIIPGVTDTKITVTRMALYVKNILECFGYNSGWAQGGPDGFLRSLSHCKNPFDIQQVIYAYNAQGQAGLGETFTAIWYRDCWISEWSTAYEITGNLIISEDVTIDVTWVDDGQELDPATDTDRIGFGSAYTTLAGQETSDEQNGGRFFANGQEVGRPNFFPQARLRAA